jgi:hypothetical protein
MITKAPKRLPSDAGVTFVGYEDIKIPSREVVRERLQEFMNLCKTSKKPAARVILGEWGEGKTDAFGRYIKKYAEDCGDAAFAVSASTISNSLFETNELSRLIQSTPSEATRFLGCLLYAIREELKVDKIPSPSQFDNMLSYLEISLSNLIDGNPRKRLFIFIDEFEELLTNQERMIKIISGIKETINGQYREIDEGGKFEGCVHFIIAATPDAWYQLQVREDIAPVFGGLGRRITPIELPEVSRSEAIDFMLELMRYSYEGNLPDPLPIVNLGIFNVVYRVTQGNPGNIVSIYTKLMNNAKIDDEKMHVIDYERLLKFLSREQVFVYGGSTPCLESENLHRFGRILLEEQRDKTVGELCSSLLKLLLGELQPFSIMELQRRLKYSRIHDLISIINNTLSRKEKIPRAILKLYPLREDKREEDILQAFKDFIITVKDERHIKIGNYQEPIGRFLERVYYQSLGDDKKSIAYLPADEDSVRFFFEGCEEYAREVSAIITKKLCTSDEEYYAVSEEVLVQVYPTPVPRELDFLKTRENRMKLWRDTTKNLAADFDDHIIPALLKLGELSDVLSFEELKGTYPKGREYIEMSFDELKIRAIFVAISGDVNSEDIEEIYDIIRRTMPPPHAVVLIYTGEVTAEAEDKIANKGLDKNGENAIIYLRVHPTLAKRLISIRKATLSLADDIREFMLRDIAKKLITQDVDLPNNIRKWLSECERIGKYVKEPDLKEASSLSEFVGGLKFFINVLDAHEDVYTIFHKNIQLRKFISFGTKKYSLYPDIALPELERLVEDLVRNGFLSWVGGKLQVNPIPAEERLIKLLKEKGKATEEELSTYFILEKTRLLIDLLIPILQHKGIIVKEDRSWKLTDFYSRREAVDKMIKRFESVCGLESHRLYGHIYMTKQRDDTTILVDDLRKFVIDTFDKITVEYNQTIALQKIFLLEMVLNHFFEELKPLIENAYKMGKNILTEAKSIISDAKFRIEIVKSDVSSWFRINFDSVREYAELSAYVDRIEKIHYASNNEVIDWISNEIKKDPDKQEQFRFDKDKSEIPFYNVKLLKMYSCWKDFQQAEEQMESNIFKIKSEVSELEQKIKEIHSQLDTLKDLMAHDVSRVILESIKRTSSNILSSIDLYQRQTISLPEIIQFIKNNKRAIEDRIEDLKSSIKVVKLLKEEENNLVNYFSSFTDLLNKAKSFFNVEDVVVQQVEQEFHKLKTMYSNIPMNIVIEESSKIFGSIDNIRKRLNEINMNTKELEKRLNRQWQRYSLSKKRFLKVLKEMMNVLVAKYKELDFSEIKQTMVEIETFLKADDFALAQRSPAELDEIIKYLEEKFFKTIKTILSEKEVLVFQYLLLNTGREKPWLILSSFKDIVRKELNIQSDELERIFSGLVSKGLCDMGIAVFLYARKEEPPCTHENRRLKQESSKRVIWECLDCGQEIIEEE